jgi:hypothetical protein
MVIKVGDEVSKTSLVNSFNESIRSPIYSDWPVNTTYLPGKLSLISYAFNNPNTTNLDTNILGSTATANLVAQMYKNFIDIISYTKIIYYSTEEGNWSNGGAVTFRATGSATYKGIMSNTGTKFGWTNGYPANNRATEGFGRSTSQPPFSKINVDVQGFFTANNIVKGQEISVSNFYAMFDVVLSNFRSLANSQTISLKYTHCHSNCHISCHMARSRR